MTARVIRFPVERRLHQIEVQERTRRAEERLAADIGAQLRLDYEEARKRVIRALSSSQQ